LTIDNGEWIIYPNPVKDQLRIANYELRSNNLKVYESNDLIEIYDIMGRLFLKSNNLKVYESNSLIIDVSSLSTGVYLLQKSS
jgi:hypothetical protein